MNKISALTRRDMREMISLHHVRTQSPNYNRIIDKYPPRQASRSQEGPLSQRGGRGGGGRRGVKRVRGAQPGPDRGPYCALVTFATLKEPVSVLQEICTQLSPALHSSYQPEDSPAPSLMPLCHQRGHLLMVPWKPDPSRAAQAACCGFPAGGPGVLPGREWIRALWAWCCSQESPFS